MDDQIPYLDQHLGIKTKVKTFHCMNSSSLWEKMWGNAAFFTQIFCEEAEGPDEFFTKSYSRNKCIPVDESFTFVLPRKFISNTEELSTPLQLLITVHKNTHEFGSETIDITNFESEKTYSLSFKFEKNQEVLKLDIEIEKHIVMQPDFRYSLDLSTQETEAVGRRKKQILDHMQSRLPDLKLSNVDEVPTIAMACSGGGYRSTIQFCGAMEAVRDSGLLNCITYLAGLSGGSWYILPAYVKQALNNVDDLLDFHSELKQAAKSSLILNSIADISHYLKYRKYARTKEADGQPTTFVDFYGYSLARTFLGYEKINTKLSEISQYAGSGDVPIPLITALHTRSKVSSATFSADMEVTPWEVSLPQYGINTCTKTFGSEWYKGSIVRACPEYPLHFFLGASSSAFGILLKYYLKGETTEADKQFVADVRKHEFGRHKTKRMLSSSTRKAFASQRRTRFNKLSENDAEGEETWYRQKTRSFTKRKRRESAIPPLVEKEENEVYHDSAENVSDTMEIFKRRTCRFSSSRTDSDYLTANEEEDDELENSKYEKPNKKASKASGKADTRQSVKSNNSNNNSNKSKEKCNNEGAGFRKIMKRVSNHPLFTDREAVIDRTSKVFNIARGLTDVKYHHLNSKHKATEQERQDMKISTEDDIITFVDAAVISNVPTNALLRRKVDILIVCDATEYKSDTDIDYLELFLSENLAKKHGLKFPKIDPQKLIDDPRGIVHVFEDKDDPECPIVIWFTLCNKEFKALKDVPIPAQRITDDAYKLPANEKFNVFPVYGSRSAYQTLNTRYTPLQFDRLKELMKHNIMSNVETIERQIRKKIHQRQGKKA